MSNKQRGGVAVFVIVALVMAGLLLGGLYLSKHTARIAHDTNTTKPQVATKDENKSKTTPAPEKTSPTTKAPVTSAPEQQTKVPTTPAPIAATGPTDTLATIVALSALAYASYWLAQSRRHLRYATQRR
jgi:cytoskeletal protein RodZ